jgi:hypothetical protein
VCEGAEGQRLYGGLRVRPGRGCFVCLQQRGQQLWSAVIVCPCPVLLVPCLPEVCHMQDCWLLNLAWVVGML